ncbi:hypothetical protein [Candidatus Binatus sp.]|uniref:hypothetical protein n=1 Tax=Candidatus Binatus sp. TaxID=2811406 RepID=UPI003BB0855D
MNLDLDALKSGLGLLTGVLKAVKGLRDLLPKGKERDQIESKVVDAEKQLALAESQIALGLGYRLCQCTFPPKIMLKSGSGDRNDVACPKCGVHHPPRNRRTFAITE